jgi:hypothetical protein
MIARALTGIGKECLTTIFLGIETRLLRNRISLLMTTLRFKWSIQYNHKILSPSGCVVWVIFQSSSDRSSSPIARSASTVALRLGLRRQRTERFLIYTLQRHEHVQRGVRSRSLGGAGASGSARQDRRRHREARNVRLFASKNFGGQISGNASPSGQNRLRARDRLRRLRASGGALFAFSAKTRSVGTIAFVVKSKCQKVDESGFPDEGKNFPDRPI